MEQDTVVPPSAAAKKWGRARTMGGGNLMVFSWHATEQECRDECARRKEALQTGVDFTPVYCPDRTEDDNDNE